jgi:hypothetical protein
MTVLKLLPVIIRALLLGAHFSRAGLAPLALMIVLFPAFLLLKRAWVARLTQFVLIVGAAEWVRTLVVLVSARREIGQPWTRLAVILGCVALFTLGAGLAFSFSSALRKRYGLNKIH